jgi:hypothetical protein
MDAVGIELRERWTRRGGVRAMAWDQIRSRISKGRHEKVILGSMEVSERKMDDE